MQQHKPLYTGLIHSTLKTPHIKNVTQNLNMGAKLCFKVLTVICVFLFNAFVDILKYYSRHIRLTSAFRYMEI